MNIIFNFFILLILFQLLPIVSFSANTIEGNVINNNVINDVGISSQPFVYTSFEGETYHLHLWEGENVVLLTKSSDLNLLIMEDLVNTFDKVFEFYLTSTGKTPSLNFHYNGKTTIAQVDKTCGAGCGFLGSTGIELLSYYFDLLYDTYQSNQTLDQVVFYEFGRNFWFYGNKIDWSGSVGTVTTGYAVFMRFLSMKAAGINGAAYKGRSFTEFENEVKNLFNKYMADASLNWENTIKIGKAPDNSMNLGGTDLFASFMFKLMDLFGNEFNESVWKEIEKRPNAANEYDAVDNFILASSIVVNQNLISLFQDWKWPVSQAAIDEANRLFGTSSLVINAKGSDADGIFAHFKVLVNEQEIGDSFTTEEYKLYIFSLPIDASEIQEVRIRFDNDKYTGEQDRNLFVKNITIGNNSPIESVTENVTYISANGHPQIYNGMMGWNGDLIFDPKNIYDCSGDIFLSSQAMINNFKCQSVPGRLSISGEDISDLSPLSVLSSIEGRLSIYDNPILTNLNGLNSIIELHNGLIIKNNLALENFVGLFSLEIIKGDLFIENNPSLKNLEGLESLMRIDNSGYEYPSHGLYIYNNVSLTDINDLQNLVFVDLKVDISDNPQLVSFCGLYTLFKAEIELFNSWKHAHFGNNGIEITKEEILANGPCEDENEIIVRAKGTSGDGEYAQFKVYADNTLLGEAYTSAEFTSYRFAIPYDPSRINKARIIFNNDYSSTFEDRNLIVEYIIINGLRFSALPNDVTYIRDMDRQEIYYDYIMPWNGQLIFDINYALATNARLDGLSEIDNQLNESLEFNFDMYPNPSNGWLTIDLIGVENGIAELFVTNPSGRHVKVEKFLIDGEYNFRTFDLTDLKQGLYILQFNDGKHLVNKKLIIN